MDAIVTFVEYADGGADKIDSYPSSPDSLGVVKTRLGTI